MKLLINKLRELNNKHNYELLILCFTFSIFAIGLLKIYFLNYPSELSHCLERFFIPVELFFSLLIFILGFLVSPVDFIHLFKDYCNICSDALNNIEKSCEIYTIQTPVSIQHDVQAAYDNYLNATANALLRLETDNSHLISSYRRLVVVNCKNNAEIENEKIKLLVFIQALFSKIIENGSFSGNLKNIKIVVAKRDDISQTPYVNMDILMIGEEFINIAIPVFHCLTDVYEWGTSINIQKNLSLRGYSREIEIFKRIYQDAWDTALIANTGNNLIEIDFESPESLENPENICDAKTKVIKRIDDVFNSMQ